MHRHVDNAVGTNKIQYNSEVLRYIDAALREVSLGNYDRAISLCSLAKKIAPDYPRVDEVHELIYKLRQREASSSNNPNATVHMESTYSQSSMNQNPSNPNKSEEYTFEQRLLVDRVNECQTLYDVLKVPRAATCAEIKKAYKKLALQLHPDKNHAPGAVEAFKTISKAVRVLTDETKRTDYDNSGANTDSTMRRSRHATSFEDAFSNDEDFTAEELFNMFFGKFPNYGQRSTYQYANQRYPTQSRNHHPSLAFGLILVLVLISMLSSFFTSDPVYSLTQTSKYPVRRETQHLSVIYYVKENFAGDYKGLMGRLENSVEEDYIYTMKQNCFRERSYREAMMARARSFGSRAQFAQAQELKMPSCDNLSKLGIRRYSLY